MGDPPPTPPTAAPLPPRSPPHPAPLMEASGEADVLAMLVEAAASGQGGRAAGLERVRAASLAPCRSFACDRVAPQTALHRMVQELPNEFVPPALKFLVDAALAEPAGAAPGSPKAAASPAAALLATRQTLSAMCRDLVLLAECSGRLELLFLVGGVDGPGSDGADGAGVGMSTPQEQVELADPAVPEADLDLTPLPPVEASPRSSSDGELEDLELDEPMSEKSDAAAEAPAPLDSADAAGSGEELEDEYSIEDSDGGGGTPDAAHRASLPYTADSGKGDSDGYLNDIHEGSTTDTSADPSPHPTRPVSEEGAFCEEEVADDAEMDGGGDDGYSQVSSELLAEDGEEGDEGVAEEERRRSVKFNDEMSDAAYGEGDGAALPKEPPLRKSILKNGTSVDVDSSAPVTSYDDDDGDAYSSDFSSSHPSSSPTPIRYERGEGATAGTISSMPESELTSTRGDPPALSQQSGFVAIEPRSPVGPDSDFDGPGGVSDYDDTASSSGTSSCRPASTLEIKPPGLQRVTSVSIVSPELAEALEALPPPGRGCPRSAASSCNTSVNSRFDLASVFSSASLGNIGDGLQLLLGAAEDAHRADAEEGSYPLHLLSPADTSMTPMLAHLLTEIVLTSKGRFAHAPPPGQSTPPAAHSPRPPRRSPPGAATGAGVRRRLSSKSKADPKPIQSSSSSPSPTGRRRSVDAVPPQPSPGRRRSVDSVPPQPSPPKKGARKAAAKKKAAAAAAAAPPPPRGGRQAPASGGRPDALRAYRQPAVAAKVVRIQCAVRRFLARVARAKRARDQDAEFERALRAAACLKIQRFYREKKGLPLRRPKPPKAAPTAKTHPPRRARRRGGSSGGKKSAKKAATAKQSFLPGLPSKPDKLSIAARCGASARHYELAGGTLLTKLLNHNVESMKVYLQGRQQRPPARLPALPHRPRARAPVQFKWEVDIEWIGKQTGGIPAPLLNALYASP
eukprot:TRINITY_DN4732_c0_g1_i1.p1 TRINITY_DN4732_c0_g1~~TRINITY_DN4732_c0_g1_i1.p1  ORF type:complete len:966 (+),score=340.39 TRINITY_DN4732_c0_g1_i1:112-3009(+)